MARLPFLLLFLFEMTASAQTKISGTVVDRSGAPIPMANIFIKDSYDGATADESGHFAFTTDESGPHGLVVRSLGFKEYHLALQLDGKPVVVKALLEEEISELKAVTISAGAFTASDESRRTVFRAVDIATTAGATADIAGALNTLPGTQKVGESGRLFVRGGDGNEARTFIDGMVVLDAYAPAAPNMPSRGRFLPFMFKGTSFSMGGYSAEFGQALSSALVLDSKDNSETTRTDIGILSVGGDVAHTQSWGRGSAAAKIQYTNIQPYFHLISQNVDWKKAPSSLEGVTAIRQKVGEHGMLKIFGNVNESSLSLFRSTVDDPESKSIYELKNKYRYVNASYKNLISEKWIVRGGLSYTKIKNNTKAGDLERVEGESGLHAKLVLDGSLSERIELKTGAEIISRSMEWSGAFASALTENVASSFAELDLYASNDLVTRIGGRGEYNSLTNAFSMDPRLSMAYKVGKSGQMSLAYGIFTQSANNQWLQLNNHLQSEKAVHYILNYQRGDDDHTFRAELYYKDYNKLVRFTDHTIQPNNAGSGFSKGFELFWRDRKTFKRADYWVSYSFLDTRRTYLNYPVSATPAFASTHNFSAVYKYFIVKLKSQLGATYSFASGRPYYNPNSTKFHADRTPDYHDLSFNWSYLPKPYLIVYASCTNLFGRDNIFGYEYASVKNEAGSFERRPVRQPAPRFLFIGIFITLSKDKSVNQLPSL